MRTNYIVVFWLIILLDWFICDATQAQSLGLDFVGGTTPYPNADVTLGWDFTLSQTSYLDALGIWDEGANGLYQNHQVAIWTSLGAPIAIETVTSQSTPFSSAEKTGQWLFQDLSSPMLLTPGTYVLGAFYAVGYPATSDVDLIRSDLFTNDTGLTVSTDPALSFDSYRFLSVPAKTIEFPDATFTPGHGAFGPNILISPFVPEPASVWVLPVGMVLFRRQSAKSKTGRR